MAVEQPCSRTRSRAGHAQRPLHVVRGGRPVHSHTLPTAGEHAAPRRLSPPWTQNLTLEGPLAAGPEGGRRDPSGYWLGRAGWAGVGEGQHSHSPPSLTGDQPVAGSGHKGASEGKACVCRALSELRRDDHQPGRSQGPGGTGAQPPASAGDPENQPDLRGTRHPPLREAGRGLCESSRRTGRWPSLSAPH